MRKFFWIAVAVLFYFSACTKIESTNIGTGLIPPIDGVTTLDTILPVFTQNFKDTLSDSLKVYGEDEHVIGLLNDPVFGKTTATTYLQLKPVSYPFSLPNRATLQPDSAVLILSFRGVYGDTSIPQEWEVREVTDVIRGDSVYNVSNEFATGSPIGSKTIDITKLEDSIKYPFEISSNQVRIKLDDTFARRLMLETDSATAFGTDSAFKSIFRGFAIGPKSSNGNALIRISLTDTNTKLALFYKFQGSDGKQDTAVSYLRFSDGTASSVSGNANYIKRDYSSSKLQEVWNSPQGDSNYAFIQTAPGTFTTVTIPGLSNLPNMIIHRAELITMQATSDDILNTTFAPPRFLLLSALDTATKLKRNIPNDYIVSSGIANTETFGGYVLQRDADGISVKAYTFDLSRYVQGIVTRKEKNYTLRLSAPVNDSIRYTDPYPSTISSGTYLYSPSNANNPANGRVKLAGGGLLPANNQIRMRLRIIYSRL